MENNMFLIKKITYNNISHDLVFYKTKINTLADIINDARRQHPLFCLPEILPETMYCRIGWSSFNNKYPNTETFRFGIQQKYDDIDFSIGHISWMKIYDSDENIPYINKDTYISSMTTNRKHTSTKELCNKNNSEENKVNKEEHGKILFVDEGYSYQFINDYLAQSKENFKVCYSFLTIRPKVNYQLCDNITFIYPDQDLSKVRFREAICSELGSFIAGEDVIFLTKDSVLARRLNNQKLILKSLKLLETVVITLKQSKKIK